MLGFTKEMDCPHYRNKTLMQVRQNYIKQHLLIIPLPTAHKQIFLFCPVCEKKETLGGSKPIFSSQKKMDYIRDLLDGGKNYTKSWVNQLSYKDRESVLKRLNSLKAFELVKYIGSN